MLYCTFAAEPLAAAIALFVNKLCYGNASIWVGYGYGTRILGALCVCMRAWHLLCDRTHHHTCDGSHHDTISTRLPPLSRTCSTFHIINWTDEQYGNLCGAFRWSSSNCWPFDGRSCAPIDDEWTNWTLSPFPRFRSRQKSWGDEERKGKCNNKSTADACA